jgi:hypothetical protein
VSRGPRGPQGPPGPSHAYLASSANNAAVSQSPAYSTVGALNQLPDGSYAVTAAIGLFDTGFNEPGVTCELDVNGSTVPNTNTITELKTGLSVMTLVSAVNLSGGGSSVEVKCSSANNSVEARNANLLLVKVDAIN